MALLYNLPEAKDAEGVTARALIGFATRTSPPGGPVNPPFSRPGVGIGALTFYAGAGFPLQLEAQPAEPINYFPNYLWFNARPYTHIRIVVHNHAAGAANARLLALFSPTPGTPTSFMNAGRGLAPVSLSITATGPLKSGWIPMDLAARDDVGFRILAIGGDGVASPALGDVELEFDNQPEVRRERWYWRDTAPEGGPPDYVPDDLGKLITFWNCDKTNVPWTAPTPEAVRLACKVFRRGKGNVLSGAQFGTSCPDTGAVIFSGPCGLILSPELEAQTIPAFDYLTGWTGVGGGGSTACHGRLQLHIYRPSTNAIIYSSAVAGNGELWFRYIPRAHLHAIPMDEMVVLAGDRYLLNVNTCNETVCSAFSSTDGIGNQIGYNGDAEITTNFDDASSYWGWAASFTEFPAVKFISDIA
jgi:hypothetical protein